MDVKVGPSTTLGIVFTLLPRYLCMLRSGHQLPYGQYLLCCPGIYVILGTFPKAFSQLCQHANGIFPSDNVPLRNFPSGNFQVYPGCSAWLPRTPQLQCLAPQDILAAVLGSLGHPSCSAWLPRTSQLQCLAPQDTLAAVLGPYCSLWSLRRPNLTFGKLRLCWFNRNRNFIVNAACI